MKKPMKKESGKAKGSSGTTRGEMKMTGGKAKLKNKSMAPKIKGQGY